MLLSQIISISIMHMPYVVVVFVNGNLRWAVIIRWLILTCDYSLVDIDLWLFVGWYWLILTCDYSLVDIGWYLPLLFKLCFIFQWQSNVFWVGSNIFIYCLQLSLVTEALYVEPDKVLPIPHNVVLVSINHVSFNRAILVLLLCSRVKK
jgi:hypothetical protein